MTRDSRFVVASMASALCFLSSVARAVDAPNPLVPFPHCRDFVDVCPQPKPLDSCQDWKKCPERYELKTPSQAFGRISDKSEALSSAIADGKLDRAADGLNGLFNGAGSQSSESLGGDAAQVPIFAGFREKPPVVRGEIRNFQLSPREGRIHRLVSDGRPQDARDAAYAAWARLMTNRNDSKVTGTRPRESIEKYGGRRTKNGAQALSR